MMLHPRAGQGDKLATQEQAVVAMAQRRKGLGHAELACTERQDFRRDVWRARRLDVGHESRLGAKRAQVEADGPANRTDEFGWSLPAKRLRYRGCGSTATPFIMYPTGATREFSLDRGPS